MSTNNPNTSNSTNQRQYEIIVFGASGYTGERIALYLANLQVTDKYNKRFAIAGRNEKKLYSIKNKITQTLSWNNIEKVRIDIISNIDTDNVQSIESMTKQCTVLIDAVGPFRFYGPPVVQSCINTGTNYVDVTGEPEYIEKMILQHDKQAKQKNISIVCACGFDSIPSDVGTQFTINQFKQKYGNNSIPTHVTALFTVKTGSAGYYGNTGTWYAQYITYTTASSNIIRKLTNRVDVQYNIYIFTTYRNTLVHSLSSAKLLASIRKQLKEYYNKQGKTVTREDKPDKPKPFYYDNRLNKYAVLFPGADAAIVRNTQQQLAIFGHTDVQPHFSVYFTVPNILALIFFAIFGIYLKIMTVLPSGIGKRFLLTYPSIFSAGLFRTNGPKEIQLKQTSFTFDYYVRGKQDNNKQVNLHTQLHGPEPGYVFTPLAAVESALTILDSIRSGKPTVPYGVLTPGSAFKNTNIIDRLQVTQQCKFSVAN